MIKREGKAFVVYSGDRRLGTHDTEAEAKRQDAAVIAARNNRVISQRSLHLLGALGQVRTEMVGGLEHLVVPVVALMEGVIHAVNAETPEFVRADTLERGAASWNGKPVTLGHPKKNGTQCSAQDPDILASHGIGTIRNARVEGKKMLCEALIDKARAKRLHPDMYQRLADGGTEEVSVGALVVTDNEPGTFNDRPFTSSWTFAQGDHLAFLPGGRGACSVEMGCGSHRAAMRVCADNFELEAGMSDDVKTAQANDTPEEAAAEEAAELIAYKTIRSLLDACGAQWDQASQLVNDLIIDETENPTETPAQEEAEEEVETARLDAVKALCSSMISMLSNIVNATYSDALMDDPPQPGDPRYNEIRAAAGARHSAKDTSLIQAMHDHTMALGATCDRKNYKLMEAKIEEAAPKIKPSKLEDPTRRYIATVKAAS